LCHTWFTSGLATCWFRFGLHIFWTFHFFTRFGTVLRRLVLKLILMCQARECSRRTRGSLDHFTCLYLTMLWHGCGLFVLSVTKTLLLRQTSVTYSKISTATTSAIGLSSLSSGATWAASTDLLATN
jgi:hypothetical protein